MKRDGRLPIGFNIPNIFQNLWVNRWPAGCTCQANSWADSSKTNSPGKPGDTRPTHSPSGLQCFQLEVDIGRLEVDCSFITCLERFLKFQNPNRAKYFSKNKLAQLVAIFLGFIVLSRRWSRCHKSRAAKAFWQRRGSRAVPDGLITLSEHKVSNTSIGICTLWWTNIAIENGHLFIVDFPIKNGDFPLLC